MNFETAPRENYESKAITDAKPGSNSLSNNQDMHAARQIFAQPKQESTEPKFLDFGNVENLYNKKTTDQIAYKSELAETTQGKESPLPSGSDIADHAKALGERHPNWWHTEGKTYKCNLFSDRVYRDMHVPLPWDEKGIPTVHGMHEQLCKSPNWEIIYADKSPLANYKPQPGDLALWDKNFHFQGEYSHVEHCGVIGKNGQIMYAGSADTQGYAENDFKSLCRAPFLLEPSVILRPKNLSR
jgi:hypothetical protein